MEERHLLNSIDIISASNTIVIKTLYDFISLKWF